MARVAVRILHLEPGGDAGELTRLLAAGRLLAGEHLLERFRAAGAGDVRIDAGRADAVSFGARLRAIAADVGGDAGLVVLGSGSIVLGTDDDVRALVATAASGDRRAVTNNRYSSDVLAIGKAELLGDAPELPNDNGVPRWLAEVGVSVGELPDRERLALDLDSPLDLELARRHPACPPGILELAREHSAMFARAAAVFDALGGIARDPRAELLVAGRLSASMLARLEAATACRIRALVEERGLRTARLDQRAPASALGLLLERDGPESIAALVGRLAEGAVIDSRVLLAHRHGADERAWPDPEDRYASDLLLGERVRDPWLRELTLAAASHSPPIALGGHSLVGPGLPLALGRSA